MEMNKVRTKMKIVLRNKMQNVLQDVCMCFDAFQDDPYFESVFDSVMATIDDVIKAGGTFDDTVVDIDEPKAEPTVAAPTTRAHRHRHSKHDEHF